MEIIEKQEVVTSPWKTGFWGFVFHTVYGVGYLDPIFHRKALLLHSSLVGFLAWDLGM